MVFARELSTLSKRAQKTAGLKITQKIATLQKYHKVKKSTIKSYPLVCKGQASGNVQQEDKFHPIIWFSEWKDEFGATKRWSEKFPLIQLVLRAK